MLKYLLLVLFILGLPLWSQIDFNSEDAEGYTESHQWIDNNSFVVTVFGKWDRDSYYIEGTDYKLIEKGQIGIYPFDLKKIAEKEALKKALDLFKENAIKIMIEENPDINNEELENGYVIVKRNARIRIKPRKRLTDINFDVLLTVYIESPYLIQKLRAVANGKTTVVELDQVAKDALANKIPFASEVNSYGLVNREEGVKDENEPLDIQVADSGDNEEKEEDEDFEDYGDVGEVAEGDEDPFDEESFDEEPVDEESFEEESFDEESFDEESFEEEPVDEESFDEE